MKSEKNNKSKGDIQQIIFNGDYYFTNKEPFYIKILWLIDWMFFCTLMLLLGIVIGSGVDKIPRNLDRNDSKIYVFVQVMGEILLILGAFFFVILFVLNKIPSIAPRVPSQHLFWKNYSGGFLLTLGLFLSNPTFADKIQYLLNSRSSDEEERLSKISNCWAAGSGGTNWPNCTSFGV
jgi:hypothetical protein